MLFCFLFGSCSKAIYIPLVLGVLFLPASKFESKRKQNIWRGITIVGCVLLVGSFMLPVLTGSMEADARGGNTDVAMQLSLILKHPVAYVKILWRALYGSFNDYVLGKDSFAHMAFMGIHRYYLMVTVLLTAVFFTEPRKIMSGETKKSLAIYKITALILSAGIVVMIWTALYLAYTEVGSMHIAGVQARYYIPLTIPVLTVLYTDKVSARWKDQNYNSVIFLCVLLIWHLTLYTDYLTRFCA